MIIALFSALCIRKKLGLLARPVLLYLYYGENIS